MKDILVSDAFLWTALFVLAMSLPVSIIFYVIGWKDFVKDWKRRERP